MRGAVVRKGTRFYVVLYGGVDPETKKERRNWVSGFETEDEAQAYLVEVARNPAFGSGVGPRGSVRLRLGDYLDHWLRTEAKQRCRAKEWLRREQIIRLHLKPRLGHVPLAKLAPVTLEEFFAGLNTRSAYHVFKALRAALNHAVRLGLIMSNPTEPVTPPRRCQHHPLLWTVEETLRFLDECRRSSPHYYPVFLAAVATGARLGELLGVRWRDMDLDAGVMLIVQELDRPRGGGFQFADPKSAKSRRSVLLPQEVTDDLRALRKRRIGERLRRGPCPDGLSCKRQHCPKWHETELVFSQPNGKPAHGHNIAQRLMGQLMAQAGVPRIRFHDLRHAHGTLLSASGVSLKVIMERLGHSTEAFTLSRYIHATPTMQREAAEVVSLRLFASNGFLTESGPTGGTPRKGDRRKPLIDAGLLARPEGLEPPTYGSGGRRSIH